MSGYEMCPGCRALLRVWFVLAAGIALSCEIQKGENMSGAAVELTDDNLEQMTSKGVALVDFWASWCGPCRMQGPIVEKVAQEFAGKALVGKLNVDENPASAEKFSIQSIPTLVIFDGGREVQRFVGVQSEQTLKRALESVLNK